MFSQTVEYALRAVAHLAYEAPHPRTTEQIAEATRVPPAYLSKVLQALSRGGVVKSQRGVGGGMSLVKRPEDLTILEVVNAVEPIQRIKTCPLGLKSHGVRLCPLHRRLDDAMAHVEAAFGGTTLAEVLSEPTKSPPLCDVGLDRTRARAL
jgi:Rrf2 family transcriptional regulator, nitric oxide-sensitive transcriptional repressor